jgi:CTP synthase
VKELRSIGIQADVLVCRSEIGVSDEQKGKIALFCNVAKDCVIINRTHKSSYEVPLALEREGLARVVLRKLGLEDRPVDLAEWEDVVKRNAQADKKVKIALVGKYVELKDAYLSAEEALTHAGIEIGAAIELVRVQPDKVCEDNVAEKLTGVQGIIVPGGAGERGANGVVAILKYAREHKIPYLGLAYGMQMAVVEYAKNVAGILGAQSQELDLAGVQPVVYAPQGSGGEPHARIGKYDSVLDKSSRLFKAYGYQTISERHNHNYEINPAFSVMLSDAGLKIVGNDEENGFIDAMELTNHPFYVIAQFQPEFRSRPNKPHPLYIAFVNACLQAYALESAT